MAVTASVPRWIDLAALRPLAALLTQLHADDPCFASVLDCALAYVEAGAAYELYNATHYRIQSHSQPHIWRYVTLNACSCETRAPWCWHRALIHLLTAHYALLHLDRCPRPQFAHIPPHDYATVLRDCDECL